MALCAGWENLNDAGQLRHDPAHQQAHPTASLRIFTYPDQRRPRLLGHFVGIGAGEPSLRHVHDAHVQRVSVGR